MKTILKGDKVKLQLGGHDPGPYSVTSIEKRADGRVFANIKGSGKRFGVFAMFLKTVAK